MEKEIKTTSEAQAKFEFSIKFILTKGEAQALGALAGYNIEDFLKVFYEKLGKAYLQPHEKDLRNLFKEINANLSKEIYRIEEAEKAINVALTDFANS